MCIEQVDVYGFAFGGRAVGRRENGKVCFVRGAVPGETVRVKIIADKKSYSEGCLESVLNESPLRVAAGCPNPCPGCSYAHVSYETELEWKQRQMESFLVRGKLVEPGRIRKPLGADRRTRWRNKLKLSLEHDAQGGIHAGYRGEDNVSLIEIEDCPLAVEEIGEAFRRGEWKKDVTAADSSVTFRFTAADGVRWFTERSGSKSRLLTETIGGCGDFSVPETSFFQINSGMSGRLAERVVSLLESCRISHLMELYCGSGCFSIIAAERFAGLKCSAVEIDPQAIETAKRNAALHGVSRQCRFIAGDAGKGMNRLFSGRLPQDSLLLADPPRTGIERRTLESVCRSGAAYLVYVSCSPDTLARDLKFLNAAGYRVLESGLIDMFPSTAHFETVTLLKYVS